MNTVLLTVALFSSPAPVVADVEQWFDLESVRVEMATYVREEANQVATFIKTSIRDGLETGAAMLELVEEQDAQQSKTAQRLAKGE